MQVRPMRSPGSCHASTNAPFSGRHHYSFEGDGEGEVEPTFKRKPYFLPFVLSRPRVKT